jgi:spermidine synthase
MALDDSWFTEQHEGAGSAYSLKITGKLHDVQSDYQHIEIFATSDWGKLMVIDGCTMVTTRDNFLYHEMMAHPALFSHAAPKRVAIIGGGDCGTLREVLKHPEVDSAVQIDIDEQVTRASEQFFPELCAANNDPRAQLLWIDGIDWINKAPAGSLDIIIVDSTDPIGPGEVLFTPDFYSACHRALADGGLVVQQSESPLLHMSILEKMYHSLVTAGFDDARTLFFPQPLYPSGWWSATLGCKGGVIDGFREQDAAQRGFDTEYYNADIHRAAFAEPEFFRKARAGWLGQR